MEHPRPPGIQLAMKTLPGRARYEAGQTLVRPMSIVTALQAHTTIEKELFYPAVRDLGTKKANEMVAEALVAASCLRSIPRTSGSRRR